MSLSNNRLHGVKLETMLEQMVAYYGWAELARVLPIRCFQLDPSIKSSLTFLRRTSWAREKVEVLYGFYLDDVAEDRAAAGQ